MTPTSLVLFKVWLKFTRCHHDHFLFPQLITLIETANCFVPTKIKTKNTYFHLPFSFFLTNQHFFANKKLFLINFTQAKFLTLSVNVSINILITRNNRAVNIYEFNNVQNQQPVSNEQRRSHKPDDALKSLGVKLDLNFSSVYVLLQITLSAIAQYENWRNINKT